jgi:hypothetical protein
VPICTSAAAATASCSSRRGRTGRCGCSCRNTAHSARLTCGFRVPQRSSVRFSGRAARHVVRSSSRRHDRAAKSATATAEAARSGPDGGPPAAFQSSNRGVVCRLGASLHPVSSQTAPLGDGPSGGRRVSDSPGECPRRVGVHAEPGAGGARAEPGSVGGETRGSDCAHIKVVDARARGLGDIG